MNEKLMSQELEKVLKLWQIELNLEYLNPNKNVRVSFSDIGTLGEMLAINLNPGYVGGGSAGMGFDLINFEKKKSIEVKTCCTIQNSKCNDCSVKFNPLFHAKCPRCESTNIKHISDSRFGINAKEFLRQYEAGLLEKLVFIHIFERTHIPDKNLLEIQIDFFELDLLNRPDVIDIILEYFTNQRDKGRNTTANLLPNSYDFFKLAPLQNYSVIARINYSDTSITPQFKINNTAFYPRVNEHQVRFYGHESADFRRLKSYDKKTKSADSVDFTKNMPYRVKSLGKERGDTRTNLDDILS